MPTTSAWRSEAAGEAPRIAACDRLVTVTVDGSRSSAFLIAASSARLPQTGAAIARDTLYGQIGITAQDIDMCELYDCYTYTTLVTLEDYGFCPKGEGGPFVADGKTGPGRSLPVNTGGGQLSSFYMWGMTPVAEAVTQVRGEGGTRQVPRHDMCLVSGNGGILSTHSTLVLSTHV